MCSIGVFIALAHGAPLMRAFNSSRRLEPVSVASISPRTLRRKLLLANLRASQPLGGCDARPPFGRAGTGRKSAVEAATPLARFSGAGARASLPIASPAE